MGKLIPPRPHPPAAATTMLTQQPGPSQLQARELAERLRSAEESLDLDELDRLARRHARPPATGAPEALEALAVVVRDVPELFRKSEVNLEPARLEQIADRQRALGLLASSISRFNDLVQDSHLEQGDEVVELLTVGWSRARALQPERFMGREHLVSAMRVLAGYQQRVLEEKAHQVPAEDEPPKKARKKK